ncbi:MAG: hypothetical protein Q9M25_02420 [Mariprofundaceae bacterium]|nr:hypothetical protein [Mariprofundaceae bacterium]
MRGIIITFLFFLAPIILMFAMRHLTLLLRIWLAWRRSRKEGADVIDITPEKPHPPSRRFIAFAVLVGIVFASLVWMRLVDDTTPQGVYVPAYVDAQGRVIPGQQKKP